MVANTEDREPWSAWANLPEGSDLAVQLGLVRPVPCEPCRGTGRCKPSVTQADIDAVVAMVEPLEQDAQALIDAAWELGIPESEHTLGTVMVALSNIDTMLREFTPEQAIPAEELNL